MRSVCVVREYAGLRLEETLERLTAAPGGVDDGQIHAFLEARERAVIQRVPEDLEFCGAATGTEDEIGHTCVYPDDGLAHFTALVQLAVRHAPDSAPG